MQNYIYNMYMLNSTSVKDKKLINKTKQQSNA